jgi:F-type H+-transporting ATPase subunit delta
MRTSRALAKQIVSTYGEVLYAAVASSDEVDSVSVQLDGVLRLFRSSSSLRDTLLDDSIDMASRADIVRSVCAGLHPALVEVMVVMAERGNIDLLSSVVDEYAAIAEKSRGVVAVDVTTAVELTDSLRSSITKKLAAEMGTGVVLREKVDPSILGGVIINAHGRRIDASIASQLEAARTVLSTASSGGEA